MSNINVGIDLGGSHVAIGVVNNEGKILEQFEKDFTIKEKENVLPVAIRYIVDTLRELKQKYDLLEFGLGMAGAISNGVILRSVNLGIENYDIKTELETKTGLSVHIKNDAKCAALAEKEYGSLKKAKDAMFLTIGTGIGGAVFLNGELLVPKKYEGFEIGHMTIERNGLECNCGRRGCFEKYASMTALKGKVAQKLGKDEITGEELKEILENIEDAEINNIVDEYIENLALGIASLINIFEPEVISIGGSFAHYEKTLLNKLNSRLKKEELFNKNNMPKIVLAKLKNDAGIIGSVLN